MSTATLLSGPTSALSAVVAGSEGRKIVRAFGRPLRGLQTRQGGSSPRPPPCPFVGQMQNLHPCRQDQGVEQKWHHDCARLQRAATDVSPEAVVWRGDALRPATLSPLPKKTRTACPGVVLDIREGQPRSPPLRLTFCWKGGVPLPLPSFIFVSAGLLPQTDIFCPLLSPPPALFLTSGKVYCHRHLGEGGEGGPSD